MKQQKGSIALISILIISAILVLLVVSMSEVNISTSYQYSNHQANKIAYYAAEACLEEALIRLESDPTVTTGNINFDSDTNCTITVSGNNIDIVVSYLNHIQHFQASFSIIQSGEANNLQLLTWQEV